MARTAIIRAINLASHDGRLGPHWLQAPQPELDGRVPMDALHEPLSLGRRFLRLMAGKFPAVADPWPARPVPEREPGAGEHLLMPVDHP